MQNRRARGPAVAAIRLATLFAVVCSALPAMAQLRAPAGQPQGPTTIEAEKIEGVSELEVTARGNAELQRDELNIFGDFLRYNQEFGRVQAEGGARLERGGDRIFGTRLRYDTRDDTGEFEDSHFILRGEPPGRGDAQRLEFLGKDRMRLSQGTFTTCTPGKEDWKFEARELDLDYEKGEARLRDGKLHFLGTTLLALPAGSFPLENQRKTGFLAPYYAHSTSRGVEAGIPFYWNIAPERDLTLTPVYMTKRGEQLKGHFRYLDAKYNGDLRFEYMPQDQQIHETRSGFSLQHQHQFTPAFLGRLDVNRVSDDRYFVDLASQVRQTSIGNLPRDLFLQYSGALLGGGYSLQGRVQTFQTLQDPQAPTVPPYHRLPQVNFGYARNDLGGRYDLYLPAEFVRFTHPTLVEGSRAELNPTLAMPVLAPGYFVMPKLGLRYADYQLSRTAPGQPERQDLTIPWLSVDSGLLFDRATRWFGNSVTQTLEPRLYYVYVPYRNQDQIPIFDTALADFNYAQMFSENRFAGGDRFGDANQVTLAVTSRLLTPAGAELLRGTLGQRYYFSDERVGLTPSSPLRTGASSDLIASLGGRVTRDLSFDISSQYNVNDGHEQRFGAAARYAPEIAKVINASYRFNRDVLKQVDISGQWPVLPGWYAIGRYNYSLLDGRLLEGTGGLEYNAGCWVFRGVLQRLQTAVNTTSTAIYFQLELNGFGSLGSDEVLTFLKRNIPGYAITNPRDGQLVPPSLRPQLPFEQRF